MEEERVSAPHTPREFLGLQDCRVFLTAGVAVSSDSLEYFKRLDMTLLEAYGMTENSGGITVNRVERLKIGSVGQPYPGTYVKINKPDGQGKGEVRRTTIISTLICTVHIIMHCTYYWYAQNTKDSHGAVHTKDVQIWT